MLDFDLALIYGYSVSAFNQQVKRNAERFPADFTFDLTPEEMRELSKSQNVISIQTTGVKGGRSKPIKAFISSGCNGFQLHPPAFCFIPEINRTKKNSGKHISIIS